LYVKLMKYIIGMPSFVPIISMLSSRSKFSIHEIYAESKM
jgi:hypothetical protein